MKSKDPAFLFYTSDFLTGTMTMTDDQVGKYIRLLCLQHQKGQLTERDLKKLSGDDPDIISKFTKTDTGGYANERLTKELSRRKESAEKNKKRIEEYWKKKRNQTDTTELPRNKDGNTAGGSIYESETVIENESENENRKGGAGEKQFTPDISIYEQWTTECIQSDHVFEQMIMNSGCRLTPEKLTELARSHLSLLSRYPSMKPADIGKFRYSLLGHIEENLNKKNGINKTTRPATNEGRYRRR